MHAELLDLYTIENVGGRPILELGARTWERDRYDAFATCYQAMRQVDDLVDGARVHGVSPLDRVRIAAEVRRFTLSPGDVPHPLFRELARVRRAFAIPEKPWQEWARAMLSDLDRTGFPTLRDYLRYCEGACVAPATIFMHLSAVTTVNGECRAPSFDPCRAVRAASVFSYLVHIVRDFRDDQLHGLQYFTEDAMRRCGVTREELRRVAEQGAPTPGFHHLVAEYRRYAAHFLARAERDLACVAERLDARHRLATAIVMALYGGIHRETADVAAVARGDVALGARETLDIIRATITH